MAIQNVTIADNGHLMITLDDGTVRDAGNVRGIPGPQGEKGIGVKGDPGPQGLQGPAGSPGTMNQKQYIPANTTTLNGVGQTVLSTTFTSSGSPVFIVANGDANPQGGTWCRLQWFRNGVAIGKPVHLETAQANVNVTYAVIATDTPPAGTNTYTLQTVSVFGPSSFQFGENDPPVANFIELTGTQGPQGLAGVGIKGFASGFVDAGQFVTLDNIKLTVTTGGNRGLSMASVSGTFTASISSTIGYINGGGGNATNWAANPVYTTTPSGSFFGYNFPNAGDGSTYLINDVTNNRVYRAHLMIGPGYTKNFISIEKLYEPPAPRVVGVASPTV